MPRKKIDDECEGRILALLQLNYSQREIVNILKNDRINVSEQTVSNVKRKIGLQRNFVEKIKFTRQRPVSTPSIVSRVIEKIDVEDPPNQRSIAQSCRISQSTISRIIKCALRLYQQLANYLYRNFVTTDESWFYLDGTEGKRNVCYIKKTDPDYETMILQQDSSRPKGFMVWAGISSRGKTSTRFVQPGTKINVDYYIDHILKPFLFRDLHRLFSVGEEKKMIYHHDSAPSHTLKKTIAFLNKSKINYVKSEEWMPKSPDAAPMDYSI